MRFISTVLAFLVTPAFASGATLIFDQTWDVAMPVPDNSTVGLSDTRSVVVPSIDNITEVEVQLTFIGGWNGDLYAYLSHGSGFSVLLNRPGRSNASPDGAGSSDLVVTLFDSAPGDIHTTISGAGPVNGNFQPDGRNVDPSLALDTDPRTAKLDVFQGLDANGDWTLFVADVSPGDTATLESWSITIIGVPEPSGVALVLLAFAVTVSIRRRRRR